MRIGPLLIKIVCFRKHFRISHQATNLVVYLGRAFALYFLPLLLKTQVIFSFDLTRPHAITYAN